MKRARRWLILALLVASVFPFAACGSKPTMTPTSSPTPGTPKPTSAPTGTPRTLQWSSPPAMTIDAAREYVATIKTNYGDIVVQLLPRTRLLL